MTTETGNNAALLADVQRLGLLAGPFGETARIFHVGFVVADLGAAVDQLGDLLKVTFTDPMDLPLSSIHTPDGDLDMTLRYVYSTRPVNVELIEARPGTLWDLDHPLQGRHLGVWADDVAAESARYVTAGMPKVAWGASDDGREMFSYHRTPWGFYVELIDAVAKDFYPAWFAATDSDLGLTS
ncbi:VOC family protein [Mycolicibacterium baixiangningiae]|uniref:VOC family protein n=1 Tax=Mycolicibacterium baixiangningiae TaxID=2761578 RepID=UPI0018D030CD|nr:VOC family protein [Mycolicibacterium baixiangningiae]